MTTVSQVTEAIYRARYDDQMSAGANAATKALQSNTAAVEVNEQAVTRSTKSAAALAVQNDQVTRTTKALEKAQRERAQAEQTLAAAVATSSLKQDQADRTIAGLDARIQKHQQTLQALNRTTASAGAGFANYGYQIQNAGYQIGDFAVQVQGGVSWTTALANQLPQLLGSFGAIGAVSGAAVAIAAVVYQMAAGKSAAEKLQEALESSSKGYDDAVQRADRYNAVLKAQGDQYLNATQQGQRYRAGLQGEMESIVTLTRYYGGLTDAAKTAEQARLDREGQTSKTSNRTLMNTARSAYNDLFFSVGAGTDSAEAAAIAKINEAYSQFNSTGQVSRQTIQELIATTRDVASQTGAGAEAFKAYRNALLDLLPDAARYEEMLRRLGVQTDALTGKNPAATIISAAQLASNEVGGQYQARQQLSERRGQIQAGLRADGLTSEQRAAFRSSLQSLSAQEYGMRGPYSETISGLRDQAWVAQYPPGAGQTIAQAQMGLMNANRGQGMGTSQAQMGQVALEVQKKLNEELQSAIDISDRQAVQQVRVADAYRQSNAAGQEAEIVTKAENDALKFGAPLSIAYANAVDRLTQSYKDNAVAGQYRRDVQATKAQDQQIETIRKEAELLGSTGELRERELAMLRERQKLVNEGVDLSNLSKEQELRISNAAKIADETRALQQQKSSLEELGALGERAFERIGDAAVANGGKGLTAIGVLKSAWASVQSDLLKLSLVNPLSNAVLGGSRNTLWSGLQAMSGAGVSGGSAGGGLFGSLGLGDISSALGLGNTLSGGGGIGGVLGLGDMLGTSLWTSGNLGAATTSALGGLGMAGPATGSQVAAAGASVTSIGGLLGGAGAGFAAGSLLNSLVGGKSTGGMIGSGGGALAGAAIGSIVPGIGTLIGGLIGGAGGGLLGGMFGPGKAHPAGHVDIGMDASGQLVTGTSNSKNLDITAQLAEAQASLAQTNAAIASRGLSLGGTAGSFASVHYGDDAGLNANNRVTLGILERLTGGSDNVMKVISTEFAKGAAASLDTAFANIDWTKNTYEALTNSLDPVKAFAASLEALKAPYEAAITKATELGLATEGVVAAQNKAVAAAQQVRDRSLSGLMLDLRARSASLDGTAGGSAWATSATRDWQVETNRLSLIQQLEALGATPDEFARVMAQFTETMTRETKAINDAPRAAAQQSLTGVYSTLNQFVDSLTTSDASPLSAMSKYGLLRGDFEATAKAVQAGDYRSLGDLQGDSAAFLAASRDINGSGEAYVRDYQAVLDAISTATDRSDALTESAMRQATEQQTETLAAGLEAIRAELRSLRAETQQRAMQPS